MSHREADTDVNRLLDEGRLGRYQILLVALTALTIVFDGIDNQLLGVSIPSIKSDWQVPRVRFAPVVALGYVGMMAGGALAGLAGDRYGRRGALLASMGVFGLATLAGAAAETPATLAAMRFVAGLGLGGAMPNATALAAEYVPARHRPVAITVTIVCVPLGATLAGLVAIPALPAIGWRGLFAVGGVVPLVAAGVLLFVLPESPRYLARRGVRGDELRRTLHRMGIDHGAGTVAASAPADPSERAPFTAIFARIYRRDTLALWLAFFSCLLAVYLGLSWLPSILSGAGLGTTVASAGIMAFNLGGVFGALGAGYVIARVGSRPPMLVMTAGAVASAGVLAATAIGPSSSVTFILAMLTLTGGLINAVQTTMYALAAHVYPTLMRATGVGTAVSVGRTGAVLSGYAGPWALEIAGIPSFFGAMAAAMVSTFIALALVGRHIPAAGARAPVAGAT